MAGLVFGIAYLLAIAAAAIFDVFVLGHLDEKWGGPWGNVQIIFFLYGVLVVPSSFVVFLIAALCFRRSLMLARWPQLISACVVSAAVAAAVALSGVVKWLSLAIDSRSALQTSIAEAVPGVAGGLVLALLGVWNRYGQRA